MRRKDKNSEVTDEIPGGDSFLDIVANIVGILVLLVVVVGLRAGGQSYLTTIVEPNSEALSKDLNLVATQINQDIHDSKKLAEQAYRSSLEANAREEAREELAYRLTYLREEVNKERDNLDDEDRRSFDIGNQIAQASLEIEDLISEQISLSSSNDLKEPEPIYHDTTPILGKKITNLVRIRLKENKVVVLPMDQLLEEYRKKASKTHKLVLAEANPKKHLVSSFGPVNGFEFRVIHNSQVITSGGNNYRSVNLVVARLVETGESREEPFEALYDQGSLINLQLKEIDKEETTIAILAYPDSFDSLVDVERILREKGYQVTHHEKLADEAIEFSQNGRATRLNR